MSRLVLWPLVGLLMIYVVPIVASAAVFWRTAGSNWRLADRSSAGLLPPAVPGAPAALRIFAARTVSWRGILAVHSWIVLKPASGAYERYDLTAWGEPIRINGFAPDGRWFGEIPSEVYAVDGAAAEAALPAMRAAIAAYRYRHAGDYRAWPGPNSNSFVATVMAAIPNLGAGLPPTAIGKDFPVDGRWLAPTPSGTGWRLSLGGYAGLTLAWVEGLQVSLLGLVAGLDIRRPAIDLPGIGRLGMPA